MWALSLSGDTGFFGITFNKEKLASVFVVIMMFVSLV
jgi:hypothetical protein